MNKLVSISISLDPLFKWFNYNSVTYGANENTTKKINNNINMQKDMEVFPHTHAERQTTVQGIAAKIVEDADIRY